MVEEHSRGAPVVSPPYPIAKVIERGLKLADSQRLLGADVETGTRLLRELQQRLQNLPADAPEEAAVSCTSKAHWAVRKMALSNPLLNFDNLLFVKRAPTMFPHMSDQHYGWWSRPGGGIYLLEGFKTDCPARPLPDQ